MTQYLDHEEMAPFPQVEGPRARQARSPLSMIGNIAALVIFAAAVALVTVALLGNTNQPNAVAAYFLNGNTVVLGRHSLDLSQPIYLRGSMPVCPSTDALANYSPGNPSGCTLTSSTVQAGLIAILTDGMKQPSFEMTLGKGPGAIRGWVDYSNLTN
jgi:hypothetical protein